MRGKKGTEREAGGKDMSTMLERWECKECGLHCRIEIAYEPTPYLHVEKQDRFVCRHCICDEAIPKWRKSTGVKPGKWGRLRSRR